jgi:pectate lyase
MNKKVFFALGVLVLVALSCSFSPVATATAPTAQPPAVNTPVAQLQILFQDDFSDVNSGWDRSQDASYSSDYENGSYRIKIFPANYAVFATPYQSFQNDVRLEVDAGKISGPEDNNGFGVICRYQDIDNYYYFYISSDGYVGIGIDNAGTKSFISSSDGYMTRVSGINLGSATNHIRADCIGTTLTLYVNGTQVASATDSSFSGGDVGLVARTFDVPGTDIMFDNFFVYKP